MSDNTRIVTRMNTVGITLSAAARWGHKMNRLQLQKFIYLSDVVGYVFEILPPTRAHITYKRGPFDVAIQNAVDALVFRGFVEASGVQKDGSGNIRAVYGLTAAGMKWIDDTRESNKFVEHWRAALEVANQLETFGWGRLVSFVYAEPTYIAAKTRGFGQSLKLNDGLKNSAAGLLGLLDTGLRSGFPESTQNRDLMIQLLFRYLDRFSQDGAMGRRNETST